MAETNLSSRLEAKDYREFRTDIWYLMKPAPHELLRKSGWMFGFEALFQKQDNNPNIHLAD